MTEVPFRIDYEWDRSRASDGRSRYGAYVRQAMDLFRETWDGTYESGLACRFAAAAWRQATGPVMSPPFAGWRAPVISADLQVAWEADDSPLVAVVTLATSQPQALVRGYDGERHWRSWPYEASWTGDYPRDPCDDELVRGSYALASLRLMFAIPAAQLPDPPPADHEPGDVEHAARKAVEAVVAELNRALMPVLTRIER
jgi:hypothetical protein